MLFRSISQAPTSSQHSYVLHPPALFSSVHDVIEVMLQVETLLEQLDTKFDDMSSQIIERSACHVPCSVDHRFMTAYDFFTRAVMQMSQRVDALEASIQDIINGDAPSSSTSSIPSSPSTTPTTLQSRRTRNGLQ